MMKYSEAFERDYEFYYKWRYKFNFCGTHPNEMRYKPIFYQKGRSAKEVFYSIDSKGKNIPCNEPELLKELLLCKASVNFNIKLWAESRADGTLPLIEFSQTKVKELYPKIDLKEEECYLMEYKKEKVVWYKDMETYYNFPKWVIEAVENQKFKYYK